MRKQLVINDQLISYLHYPGSANQPALIFLHGWRSQGIVWEKTVLAVKAELEVGDIYCLDLPGFGESAKLKTVYNLSDYCETIKAFKEKLNLASVILIGHSFGGRIIIKLLGENPKMAKSAILVDSAGLINNKVRRNAATALAKVVRPIFWPSFMRPLRKKIYQFLGAEDYVSTPELRGTFVNVINEDLGGYLNKIACPIKIIWGSLDLETPLSDAKFMNQEIANSDLSIIEGVGHYCFLEKPKEFNQILIEFLKQDV